MRHGDEITPALSCLGRFPRSVFCGRASLNAARSSPYFCSFWVTLRLERPLWRAVRATLPLCSSSTRTKYSRSTRPIKSQVRSGRGRSMSSSEVRGGSWVRGATDSGKLSRLSTVPSARLRAGRFLRSPRCPAVVPEQGLHVCASRRSRTAAASVRAVLLQGNGSPAEEYPRYARLQRGSSIRITVS